MNILEKMRQPAILAQVQQSMAQAMNLEQHKISAVASSLRSLFVSPPKSALLATIESQKATKNPHGYAEITRILNLDIQWPLTPEESEAYSRDNMLAVAFNEGIRLKERQASALWCYDMSTGPFCPIGAGCGKTLIGVGIATRAYEKGLKKILLLVPPQVYSQLVMHDLALIRSWIPVRVPFIALGNTTSRRRIQLAKSGRHGCYILPYSCLSTQDASEVLLAIDPDCIIADEAHSLSYRTSARTNRIIHFLEHRAKQGRVVEFIPMSGTITGKTIMEYQPLIGACLNINSPLPLSPTMANEWGHWIDAEAEEYTGDASLGQIQGLVDWARLHFPQQEIPNDISGFRTAYRLRLNSAPGVVSTGDAEIGTSLYIANRVVEVDKESDGWKRLDSMIDGVLEGLAPNGDIIEHAIHGFRWLYELSAGFYNQMLWPSADTLAKRKNISIEHATDIIERAIQHHEMSQIFAKELRAWLSTHNIPSLDTPLLVRSSMAQNGHARVGKVLYTAWQEMKRLEFEEMPIRDKRAVRVFDYKVKAVADWYRNHVPKGAGCLVWAYNNEIIEWTAECLSEAGLDPLVCYSGEQYNRLIRDPKNKHRLVVASIAAHGTGKNLQHFQHQYCVQWPRPAKTAEQLLARTHRTGQKADELIVYTNFTTEFDRLNYAACLNDALYIQQTLGNRQRIIYAGYDPLPTIFPPSVLKERGMQNRLLSPEQEKVMQALFGKTQTEAA